MPLGGQLKRLPDGSKTEPQFEKNWKLKYSQEFNKKETPLGGVITGKISNIVAVDCDNDITWDMFSALAGSEAVVFRSKGKGSKVCGTFIFRFSDDICSSFNVADGTMALDFYNENGFVYLPTVANETKHLLEAIPVVTEMPKTIKILLQNLKQSVEASKSTIGIEHRIVSTAMCLQPLVQQFTDLRKFLPGLFKIITPKDFRSEAQYVKQGYLHPNNVPEGRGSEYLTKVSAILGADISIDAELYTSAMHDINNLWDSPMDPARLDKTILDPMVLGKSSIDGRTIWQYDENWMQRRLVLRTKRQSSIEVGFDDRRDSYYVVDIANQYVKSFYRDNDLQAYLEASAFATPKKADLKKVIPLLNVTSKPGLAFGFHEGYEDVRELNTFIRTPELAIINDPDSYKQFYKTPGTILKFLETLIPEAPMRKYLLKFLKRKFKTFDYSPVILYFLGVHGSGKDTFVEIIQQIMGNITKPTTREFLEMYNAWLMDSYFVQLDEYGNQLTNIRDKEEVLGKLKTYTGSPTVQIRQMRTDSFTYKHSATFIMTANKQPLMLEDGDRRIIFFSTPNVLKEADWVQDVVETREQIFREIKDFCYYLAVEVQDIANADYVSPPESKEKNKLIADSMHPAAKLAYVLKHKMLEYLKELAIDHNSTKLAEAIDKGRVYTTDLEDIYGIMTDFNGDMRSLNKVIKAAGINVRPTTINGSKAYYYDLWFDNPFEEHNDE